MLPLLLTLAAMATPTFAQSTTVDSMFGYLGASYLASVIAVESSTTTLHLDCPSVTATAPIPDDADYACFDSTLVVTTASDYFGAVITDGDATGTLHCSLGGTTIAACTQIYTNTDTEDNPSQTAETATVTLSAPEDFVWAPVTITAGMELLGGAAAQATGVSAARTTSSGEFWTRWW